VSQKLKKIRKEEDRPRPRIDIHRPTQEYIPKVTYNRNRNKGLLRKEKEEGG
jgi:hypothetical protein